MNERMRKLYLSVVEFDPDPHRVQHLTKVHAYSRFIAEAEKIDPAVQETLEAAAIVHDIAIRLCLEKYGSDAGNLQEQEGPALVHTLLEPLGYEPDFIERVCWLVAHHHTYQIDSIDHQILVEADFLVNAYEGRHSDEAIQNTLMKIFKTPAGTHLFKTIYAR